MNWLLLVILAVVCLFGMVVLFGAPYLPTLGVQTELGLDMLGLKPGQTLLELGSGDGRVLRVAAKRGMQVIGYELNPLLVVISYIVTWKYRRQVKIIWGNYWLKNWPQADGIYVFLLNKYMPKLDTKIVQQYGKNVKLVSFAFKIPGRKLVKSEKGIFLYQY
jgi:hypothetical protein